MLLDRKKDLCSSPANLCLRSLPFISTQVRAQQDGELWLKTVERGKEQGKGTVQGSKSADRRARRHEGNPFVSSEQQMVFIPMTFHQHNLSPNMVCSLNEQIRVLLLTWDAFSICHQSSVFLFLKPRSMFSSFRKCQP
jgi:hypothetical protein